MDRKRDLYFVKGKVSNLCKDIAYGKILNALKMWGFLFTYSARSIYKYLFRPGNFLGCQDTAVNETDINISSQ